MSESAWAAHQLVAGGRRRLRDVPDDQVAVGRAAGQQVRAAGVELQALKEHIFMFEVNLSEVLGCFLQT